MSTRARSAEGLLLGIRREFDWHVAQHRGSGDYPLPSLTNPIHPMFKLDRFVTGHGQHTSEFYNRMLPALQLVSLWLTEDYTLLWYSDLTFGERRTNSAGQTYAVPTPFSSTPAALDIVKANLIEFGKTIAFMFTPSTCGDEAGCWGVT